MCNIADVPDLAPLSSASGTEPVAGTPEPRVTWSQNKPAAKILPPPPHLHSRPAQAGPCVRLFSHRRSHDVGFIPDALLGVGGLWSSQDVVNSRSTACSRRGLGTSAPGRNGGFFGWLLGTRGGSHARLNQRRPRSSVQSCRRSSRHRSFRCDCT